MEKINIELLDPEIDLKIVSEKVNEIVDWINGKKDQLL